MNKKLIVNITSWLYIALFLYAGISKLFDYDLFEQQIAQSPILAPSAKSLSWILPALEISISLILIIPGKRITGLYASFVLMLFFTGYIIWILNFSNTIPCSCGGILESMSWKQHLLFNILFLLLAAGAITIERKRTKPYIN